MRRDHLFSVLASAVALTAVLMANLPAWVKGPDFTRKEDVVYGRKYGTALTMGVFTPKENANGAAVVWVISGGWFSAHEVINPGPVEELLKRGYTVFAVVHGSQPRYTIPEIVADMNRAVRFIRYHAADYSILKSSPGSKVPQTVSSDLHLPLIASVLSARVWRGREKSGQWR